MEDKLIPPFPISEIDAAIKASLNNDLPDLTTVMTAIDNAWVAGPQRVFMKKFVGLVYIFLKRKLT